MKKYITTDKHPVFKSNIEFSISDCGGFDLSNFHFNGLIDKGYFKSIATGNINLWIQNGWIKEIQEPKWTDDELEEIVNNVINRFIGQPTFDYSIHVDTGHKNWPIILKDEIEQFKK